MGKFRIIIAAVAKCSGVLAWVNSTKSLRPLPGVAARIVVCRVLAWSVGKFCKIVAAVAGAAAHMSCQWSVGKFCKIVVAVAECSSA